MDFQPVVELVGKTVDAVGVAVVVLGAILATGSAARRLRRGEPSYQPYRRQIGRSILLGLEFLVAADIIRTVAVAPSFRGVGVLAVVVAVRTFLSFTLDLELEGRWPWQSGQTPRSRPTDAGTEPTVR